jgi:hypothetical protein
MGLFDDVLDNVGEPFQGGKGFEYGTWPVVIGTAEAKAKDTKGGKGNKIIEVVVFDKEDNDKKATCTLWFHTEGAAKMSVTKVLGLLVHKVAEDKKDQVRELGKKLFGSVTDISEARDVATKLMQDKLIGAEGFVFCDPQGKYKTTAYGDLWHYNYEDPNADDRAERAERAEELGGEDVTKEMGDDLPKFEGDEGDDL